MMHRLLLFAIVAYSTWAQPLLFRPTDDAPAPTMLKTPAGEVPVSASPVTPDRVVTLVLLTDTLRREDFDALRKGALALYSSLPKDVELHLAAFAAQSVQQAGPYANKIKFTEALMELAAFIVDEPAQLNPAQYYAALASSTNKLGGNWPYVIFAGRLPDVAEPDYVAAGLLRAFSAAKLRPLLWWPSSEASPLMLAAKALDGGNLAEDPKELIARLKLASPLAEISWQVPPRAVGFELFRAFDVPILHLAKGFVPPDADRYGTLRQKVTAFNSLLADPAKARQAIADVLEINPGELEVLRQGSDWLLQREQWLDAAPLLETRTAFEPGNAPLFDQLGHALYRGANLAGAEPPLRAARKLKFTSARNSEELARISLGRKDDAAALPYLVESLNQDPKQQPLWFERADAAERLKDRLQAALALESGLALGGTFRERRLHLVDLYLVGKQKGDALRHVDRLAQDVPADAPARAVLAELYDQLEKPAQALPMWRRTIEADAKHAPAHTRVSRLLLDGKNFPEALTASEAGIAAAPLSGPLHLAKSEALEGQLRLYEARETLRMAARKIEDADVLRRAAERADAYSRGGAQAYRRLAERLLQTNQPTTNELRRGLLVALRDEDSADAAWFREKLGAEANVWYPQTAAAQGNSHATMIVGGRQALATVARSKANTLPENFLAGYARTVVALTESVNRKPGEIYRAELQDHFENLRALEAYGVKSPEGTVITLDVGNKDKRKQAERVLSLLGYRVKSAKNGVLLEAAEKGDKAKRHETAAALKLDEIAMRDALQAGKPFAFTIPMEWVPIYPDEPLWRTALSGQDASPSALPGGLVAALAQDSRAAKTLVGLNTMDRGAADALLQKLPLRALIERHADLTLNFASALSVQGGSAEVPGGAEKQALWAQIVGADPRTPGTFFQALYAKDEGRLLAFFHTLSQLDNAHQSFATRTPARLSKFYQQFRELREVKAGVGKLLQENPLGDFLRDVPLDGEGNVRFPGSPEVWLVAKGQRSADSLAKKLNKAVAPDAEDEILFRLANTRYKSQNRQRSELDNFLAVANIDHYRPEPLDESTALLLAQNYADTENFYPHFTELKALRREDFVAFFALSTKLRELNDPAANRLIGFLAPAVEILGRLENSEDLLPAQAAMLFRKLVDGLNRASGPGAMSAVAMEVVRALAVGGPPDARLRDLLAGPAPAADFALDGAFRRTDTAGKRRLAFDRVLEMQKVPRLETVLAIDQALKDLSAGKGQPDASLKLLDQHLAALPFVEIPKKLKLESKQRDQLEVFDAKRLAQLLGELKQNAARKKGALKEIQKSAGELADSFAPYARLAIEGLIYATYLQPDDAVVSEDPLLLRKHQYVQLDSTMKRQTSFEASALVMKSEGAGSFFAGTYAQFASAAGLAASFADRVPHAENMISNDLGAIRATNWSRLRDADLQVTGLQIRLAREWIVQAAQDPVALQALAREATGRLSLSRRAELLNGLATREWKEVWDAVTMSDLFFLGERYPTHAGTMKWRSPVTEALAQWRPQSNPARAHWLGSVTPWLCQCKQPNLTSRAPYEQFTRLMRLESIGERSAEFKLSFAYAADNAGLPASALGGIVERVARAVFRRAQMSDDRDWAGYLATYAAVDEEMVKGALNEP